MTKAKSKVFTFLVAYLIIVNGLSAQTDTIKNTSTLWHKVEAYTSTRVVLPDDFESTEAHTLVIALHGYGATAEDFLKYSKPFIEAGFIYAAPEAPYPYFGKNGKPGYEWFLYDISSSTMPERAASNIEKAAMRVTSEKQMGQVISDLNEKYKVDKIYVMGFAQGGPIAYLTGIHHYNKIDGMIILSSFLDKDWLGNDKIEDGKGVRTLIIQGEQDKFVPTELVENTRDLLIEKGYDVTYNSFVGGHIVPVHLMGFIINWINKE